MSTAPDKAKTQADVKTDQGGESREAGPDRGRGAEAAKAEAARRPGSEAALAPHEAAWPGADRPDRQREGHHASPRSTTRCCSRCCATRPSPRSRRPSSCIFKVDRRLGADRRQKGKVKRFGQARSAAATTSRRRTCALKPRARSSTSPGRPRNARRQSQADVARPPRRRQGRASAPVQGPARSVAARAADAERRPQQQRPHHDPPQGRRSQAPLPRRRLRAQQGRAFRRRSSASSTTRTAPPTSRWSATPTASAAT